MKGFFICAIRNTDFNHHCIFFFSIVVHYECIQAPGEKKEKKRKKKKNKKGKEQKRKSNTRQSQFTFSK